VKEFWTNQHASWSRLVALTYMMVKEQRLTHDGNPDLARHVRNALPHTAGDLTTIRKVHKESSRHIDAACALTLAVGARHETPVPRRLVDNVW
jgi:phage terminase large subunit-like protein